MTKTFDSFRSMFARTRLCLHVSPSKGNQGTTRGKEKFILTSVVIEQPRPPD